MVSDGRHKQKLCARTLLTNNSNNQCIYATIFNNCPTRCNTKQSIYYSSSSPYTFWVLTTPIIRSTQNCNYSLQYWSYICAAISLQRGQVRTWPRWREVAAQIYDQYHRVTWPRWREVAAQIYDQYHRL